MQQTVRVSQRRVTVPGLLRSSGASARVQALGGPTRIGRAGTGKVTKPKVRKRTGKVVKKKSAAKKKR